MADEPRWLIVTKPLRAPLRDGTTVMAAGLVSALPTEWQVAYLGDPEAPLRPGRDRIIPTASVGYAPGLGDRARMMMALVDPRWLRLPVHLVFSPSQASQLAVAGIRRLSPGRRFVQTIPASDGAHLHAAMLKGLDAIVVTSEHGRDSLLAAGLDPARVHCIYPGVEVPAVDAGDLASRNRVLYAGDLDGPVAARLIAVAGLLQRPELQRLRLTIACRPKGPDDAIARARLRRELVADLAAGRVELLREVDDMDTLLRTSLVQLYLADHVRKKVDLPLVLLEGMARGVALAALDVAPVAEIYRVGQAEGCCPGPALPMGPPGALALALAAHLTNPFALLTWGHQARELAQRRFGLATMAGHYLDLYRTLDERHV